MSRLAAVSCSAAAAVGLVACSGGGSGSPAGGSARSRSSPSPTAQIAGSVRTVITPLGLNIRSQPSRTASVAGTAAWGTLLTVLDHRSDNGGWYQVQGETVTGWISADASLSAAGQFNPYQSAQGFSSLYPASWTFAEEPADTLFRPQQGSHASIVVRTAANLAAFGNQPAGYASTYTDDSLVVCGYTGTLVESALVKGASPAPEPSGSTATALPYLADIRLRFDAGHAMDLTFNYEARDQLTWFQDFYNAISFPYPLCQGPASPAPQPT